MTAATVYKRALPVPTHVLTVRATTHTFMEPAPKPFSASLHTKNILVTLSPVEGGGFHADAHPDIASIIQSYMETGHQDPAIKSMLNNLVDHIIRPILPQASPQGQLSVDLESAAPAPLPAAAPVALSAPVTVLAKVAPKKKPSLCVIIPREMPKRKRRVTGFLQQQDDPVEPEDTKRSKGKVSPRFVSPAPKGSPRTPRSAPARSCPSLASTIQNKKSPRMRPVNSSPHHYPRPTTPRPSASTTSRPSASPRQRPQSSPRSHPQSAPRPQYSPRAPYHHKSQSLDDGFVLPFAMPVSFRAEAWTKQKAIDTPQWQTVAVSPAPPPCASAGVQGEGAKQGQPSSRGRHIKTREESSILGSMMARPDTDDEEDLSSTRFFQMHESCVYALRRENLQIINRVLKRKKADAIDDGTPSKELEANFALLNKPFVLPALPAGYLDPPVFNYDSSFDGGRPWKRPKKYIREQRPGEAEASDDLEAAVAAVPVAPTPEVSRRRKGSSKKTPSNKAAKHSSKSTARSAGAKATKASRTKGKKGSKAKKLTKTLQAQHHVALLKLRYLHLRKQLALLQSRRQGHAPEGSSEVDTDVAEQAGMHAAQLAVVEAAQRGQDPVSRAINAT